MKKNIANIKTLIFILVGTLIFSSLQISIVHANDELEIGQTNSTTQIVHFYEESSDTTNGDYSTYGVTIPSATLKISMSSTPVYSSDGFVNYIYVYSYAEWLKPPIHRKLDTIAFTWDKDNFRAYTKDTERRFYRQIGGSGFKLVKTEKSVRDTKDKGFIYDQKLDVNAPSAPVTNKLETTFKLTPTNKVKKGSGSVTLHTNYFHQVYKLTGTKGEVDLGPIDGSGMPTFSFSFELTSDFDSVGTTTKLPY